MNGAAVVPMTEETKMMSKAAYEAKINEQRNRFAAARAKAATVPGATRGAWHEALCDACEYLEEGMESCAGLDDYEYAIAKASAYAFAAEKAMQMLPCVIAERAQRVANGYPVAA